MKRRYRFAQTSPVWRYISYAAAGLVLVPIIIILASWTSPSPEIWQHIVTHSLARLVLNSVILLIGVLTGSAVLGLGLAWLTTQFEFPGRAFFDKALMLPFAIPSYVLGFVYAGLLDYAGPVQTAVRQAFGVQTELWNVRSMPFAIICLTLALYPYVYFLCRDAFISQGQQMIEAARSLGQSYRQIFWRLAIPLATPWLVGSLSLVGMETLADFGTVSIFVVDTFTTAIYKAWFGFFSLQAAAQLASLLLVPMALLYVLDQRMNRARGFQTEQRISGSSRQVLPAFQAWSAFLVAALIFALGFVLPVIQLGQWAVDAWPKIAVDRLWLISVNSFKLAFISALLVSGLALVLVYALRFFGSPKLRLSAKLATLGYALPGSVLAVGVYLPINWMDQRLADAIEWVSGEPSRLLLTGGMTVMLLGMCIRFMAVAYASLFSAQQRISTSLDEAAMNFGVYGWQQMRRLHLPLLKSSLLSAALLVFVDVLKEMPLTLMTRPFGWDTLSVRIFEYTSEGEWALAAVPGLCLVLIGLMPVVLMKPKRS